MAINSSLGSGKKVWGALQGVKRFTLKASSGSGVTATFSGQTAIINQIKKSYRVTGTGLTSKANVLSVNPAAGTVTIIAGTGSFSTGSTYVFTS